MRSNYPRSVEASKPKGKPRIWPYAIGLGLVIVAVFSLYASSEQIDRIVGIYAGSLRMPLRVVVWLTSIVLGTLLIWKTGWWRVMEKLKLILLTGFGSIVAVFLVVLIQRKPMRIEGSDYWSLLGGGLIVSAVALAVCLPVWIVYGALQRKVTRAELELRQFSEQEIALNANSSQSSEQGITTQVSQA